MATAETEWNRHSRASVSDVVIANIADDIRKIERELRQTQRGDSLLERARLLLLRASAWVMRQLGISEREWWLVCLGYGVLAVLPTIPFLIIYLAPVEWIIATMSLAFLVGVGASALSLKVANKTGIDAELVAAKLRNDARMIRIAELQKRLPPLDQRLAALKQIRRAEEDYHAAVARHQKIKDYLNDRRIKLRTTDWRPLRDIPFERFLEDVFDMLGYQVKTTKRSGDQGVDLIVIGRGRKIAIQAKGYEGSVGNKAVQEAYAGMSFYDCNEAVVITNSAFTSGAEALATKIGCRLIDGTQILDLIDGKIY